MNEEIKGNTVLKFPERASAAVERTSVEARCERFRTWWQSQPRSMREALRRVIAEEELGAELNVAARDVLDTLNRVRTKVCPGKRAFRATDSNLRLLRGRLADGIEPGDLKAIVIVKGRQVADGTFEPRYFRPATLFNATRCEQYLGELGADA